MQKSCFEKHWKYINKNMSAEDDIFLAEESPIAHRRKLSYVYYKNKIWITM